MSAECERMGGINLSQGVCDTPVPPEVRAAADRAIEDGKNQYTRPEGVAPLRQAIAKKLKSYNRIDIDPDRELVITVGATGALYCAFLALLNPGDEVVLFEPFYGLHVHCLELVGAVPTFVNMRAPDWRFTREQLASAITPRTKAILLNTPANPSGKVFSRSELQWIADLAQQHNLVVFADEIYEYFLYEDAEHISIATLPGMAERTVTVSGYSKTFSITGWRIGYAACRLDWADAIKYFNDLAYVCAPAPFQHAVAAGIAVLPDSFYDHLRKDYSKKRQVLCQALKDVGLSPSMPNGAYYVLADASVLPGVGPRDRALHLLKTTGVATVPGNSFYHDRSGDTLVRLCYAKTGADLKDACQRLEKIRTATTAV